VKIVRTDAELELPRVDARLRANGASLVLLPETTPTEELAREVRDADLLLMCYAQIPAFVIDGARGRETLPRCPMTFAYWNPRILQARQLINTQTGTPTPVTITSLGNERIEVRGAEVESRRYRLETERNLIDVWYSPRDEWLALRTTTKAGGHVLSWRRR